GARAVPLPPPPPRPPATPRPGRRGMGSHRPHLPALPLRAAPAADRGAPPGLHPRGAAAGGRRLGPFWRHAGNNKLTAWRSPARGAVTRRALRRTPGGHSEPADMRADDSAFNRSARDSYSAFWPPLRFSALTVRNRGAGGRARIHLTAVGAGADQIPVADDICCVDFEGRPSAERRCALPSRNLGTYWAQAAAMDRCWPVPTGQTCAICHPGRTASAAAYLQVRTQTSTSGPGWATMQRVPRRCSSVGRAAVL